MVRVLIGLRGAIARHQAARAGVGWLVAGGILGLLSAAGTLMLGLVDYSHPGAGTDVIAFVLALWFFGRVGQSALAGGDGMLRPELFALLPVPRRRLARSLLVVGLADPALLLLLVAFGAIVTLGAESGPAAIVVGLAGLALSVVLVGVLSTIAGGVLGPASRRGHDLGTVVTAAAISVVAVAGTLLPLLVGTLEDRSSPTLSAIVRLLPSGWGVDAVDAAGRSDWLSTALPLLGLLALVGLATAMWPRILVRRMEGAAVRSRPAGRRRPRAGRLPGSPTGAVVGKELRLWGRDPIRLTCLIVAGIVGVAACTIPLLGSGTEVLLPFAGALTVLIAGACACNLYGSDGTSLWLTVVTPESACPDVRGRQAAWLLIVAPYAIALTVVTTAISGQSWAWPWVLAGLPALLGGAAGLAPYASLISVQPPDEAGGITPAWSLKVHVALVAVALTATPPVLLLALGELWHDGWMRWAAVPVGILTGLALAFLLGRRSARRLETQEVAMLRTLASAAGV